MSEQAPWKKNAIEATAQPAIEESAEPTMASAIEIPTDSALAKIDTEDSEMVSTGNRTYSSTPDLRMDELLIPRLRLAQGQTSEVLSGDAKPGQWVLVGNGASDEVEVVIMSMGRARELRHRGGDDDGKVLCRSKDAVIGVGDPGGVCELCPMQEWTDNPRTGRRQMPACAQIYSYQVFSVTHNALALLEFKRTGLDAAKMINTMIAMRGMGEFVIKLSGNKRTNGNTTFYAPQVAALPISEEVKFTAQMFMPKTQ